MRGGWKEKMKRAQRKENKKEDKKTYLLQTVGPKNHHN